LVVALPQKRAAVAIASCATRRCSSLVQKISER
jgi:hypothetical protein